MKIKLYILCLSMSWGAPVFSHETEMFKTEFLTYLGHNANVEFDESIKAGHHFVTVYINNKKIGIESIEFKNNKEKLQPCFDNKILTRLNLNYEKLGKINTISNECIFIEDIIKGAYTVSNYDDEILDVNIPQVYLSSEPYDYISSTQWNKGENSYAVKYDMNYTSLRKSNSKDSQYYRLFLDQHLNLASWHIYNSNVLTAKNDDTTKYKFNELYAEHSIASIKSALTIGEITTNSDYFSWIKYKGIKLVSDDRMKATSITGFAPVIQGIANSPSLLSIEYNGRSIYEKNIPAGEYNVTDLPRTYGNGYLNVILTSADGNKTVQEIPISSIATLIRPGSFEYTVNVGELAMSYPRDYQFLQADVKYGANNYLTVYSSIQVIFPHDYTSWVIGGTLNTDIGAISLEYYQSYADIENNKNASCNLFCKDKIILGYNEDLPFVDANISLSATRYLDNNYLELNNFISKKYDFILNAGFSSYDYRQVSDVAIRKSLPNDFGSLVLSGYYAEAWNNKGKDNYSYSISYNNNYKKINYNASIFSYRNDNNNIDNTMFFNVNIPMETKNKNINLVSSYINYADSYNTRMSLGINDKSLDKTNVNIWVDTNSQHDHGYGASLGYNNGYDFKTMGFTKNDNSKMMYGNIKGSIIAHAGGINRVSDLGKTYSIVKAIGAEGMKISQTSNMKISDNGYGIMPNLTPYKRNYITLDSKKSMGKADVEDNKLMVIPEAGSSTLVEFKVKKMLRKILKINSNEYEIPFGTKIVDSKENILGITDQNGFVYLTQLDENENENKLKAIWSKDNQEYSCLLNPAEINDNYAESGFPINIKCI